MEVTADRNRFKQQLDLTHNDKQNLDRVRSSQAKQIEELGSEVEKLKLVNADLHRTRDHLEDEREATGMYFFLVCSNSMQRIMYKIYPYSIFSQTFL